MRVRQAVRRERVHQRQHHELGDETDYRTSEGITHERQQTSALEARPRDDDRLVFGGSCPGAGTVVREEPACEADDCADGERDPDSIDGQRRARPAGDDVRRGHRRPRDRLRGDEHSVDGRRQPPGFRRDLHVAREL